MSYLLFIDESGQDRRDSPYEVLAGVAIKDKKIWPLVQRINAIQKDCFGVQRYRKFRSEAKGTKILKRKTFRQAATCPALDNPDRRNLAYAMLADGTRPAPRRYGCRAFASIVPQKATRPEGDTYLRKDYTYLFERFAHMLNQEGKQSGIIVFDELEKSQSHILINQMENYFLKTKKGQSRSSVIVPEPLFVHSDLTTMVQIADLIAYVVAWGVRLKGMKENPREELRTLADLVLKLRYYHRTPSGFDKWGFKLIKDLRTQNEVNKEEGNAA